MSSVRLLVDAEASRGADAEASRLDGSEPSRPVDAEERGEPLGMIGMNLCVELSRRPGGSTAAELRGSNRVP